MKCPLCKHDAKEKKIEIFEETYGMVNTDFDVLCLAGALSRGLKKARLAIQEKKLYECTNPDCLHEFEA